MKINFISDYRSRLLSQQWPEWMKARDKNSNMARFIQGTLSKEIELLEERTKRITENSILTTAPSKDDNELWIVKFDRDDKEEFQEVPGTPNVSGIVGGVGPAYTIIPVDETKDFFYGMPTGMPTNVEQTVVINSSLLTQSPQDIVFIERYNDFVTSRHITNPCPNCGGYNVSHSHYNKECLECGFPVERKDSFLISESNVSGEYITFGHVSGADLATFRAIERKEISQVDVNYEEQGIDEVIRIDKDKWLDDRKAEWELAKAVHAYNEFTTGNIDSIYNVSYPDQIFYFDQWLNTSVASELVLPLYYSEVGAFIDDQEVQMSDSIKSTLGVYEGSYLKKIRVPQEHILGWTVKLYDMLNVSGVDGNAREILDGWTFKSGENLIEFNPDYQYYITKVLPPSQLSRLVNVCAPITVKDDGYIELTVPITDWNSKYFVEYTKKNQYEIGALSGIDYTTNDTYKGNAYIYYSKTGNRITDKATIQYERVE